VWFCHSYDCQQEEARASEVKTQQKEEMDRLTVIVEQCEKKKQDVTKSHEADLTSYNLWLQAVETAASNFAACERKDLKLREDHKHARQDEKKSRKALDKEKERLVELESLPEMSERKIKQFEEQLKILNERKAEEDTKLQEVFAGLKDATCELQMEKDKKEKVLGEKRDIANAAKTKLTLASEEMELFTKKQTCLQAQLEKAQESARTMEQTVKARRLSLKQLEKDLPATQDQLRKAEKELEMTVKQEEELTAKVTEMIAKVEQNKVSLSASQQQ
jgi:structural maintenance of chromosome 4